MSDDEFSAEAMRNIAEAKSTRSKLVAEEWEKITQCIKEQADKGEHSATFGSLCLWKVNADKLVDKGFVVRRNIEGGHTANW